MSFELPAELSVTCERCAATTLHQQSEDLRCLCGSLIARVVGGSVELKCRRCKRVVMIAIEGRVG